MWKEKLNNDPTRWLLDSNPWTRYKTISELLDRTGDACAAKQTKKELLKHELVQQLIKDTTNWYPQAVGRHNDPQLSHYKLRMLADFGINSNDPGINDILKKAASHQDNNLYAIRQQLPEKSFTKVNPDADEWHALPCDSPIIAYILKIMEWKDPDLNNNIDILINKWNDPKGWFCHFFFVEGHYKKLGIGCPMAGLMTLELLSTLPGLKESEFAKNAFAPIKFHYDYGKTIYYFGRSSKFRTLKYPYVWYNALYMAEVLSRFDFCKEEPLMQELIDWILSKQDEKGRFKPTSMFQAYKGWDFTNKKEASPWITFLCCRILKRFYN